MTHRHYNTFYNSALKFANILTSKQRNGQTPEDWATDEATEKCVNLDAMLEREANQQMIDISTGKIVGTRREIGAL